MKTRNLILTLFLLATVSLFAQTGQRKAYDANLENYIYPYPVRYLALRSQQEELKMAYMDLRPMDPNGKSVLLLHGKNFNGAYWKETAKRLTQEGYRVIVPDQIGFGKSSKPENYQYTFQQLAQNTKAVLDTLHVDKITVVGHSMGGMLASRFALMYPDMADKLVLVNPIGLEDWRIHVPYQSVDAWYKQELSQNYETLKKYQQENYYGGEWKSEYDEWLEVLAGWTVSKDYPRIAWNSALTYEMIFTQPVVYEFSQLNMPTLLIIGQRDKTALGKNRAPESVRAALGNYPKLGIETQQKISDSKLIQLDNVGHLPHIEAFDKFISPFLEFLKAP
jgi:pimeloyl-ACP methyl ester carboxylesterase